MTEHSFWAILAIATFGSIALVMIAGIAFHRRRSRSYLLITAAIGMLVLRSILGLVTLGGIMSHQTHHMLEHLLDVVVIGLLFAAVYAARTADPGLPVDNSPTPRDKR